MWYVHVAQFIRRRSHSKMDHPLSSYCGHLGCASFPKILYMMTIFLSSILSN